MLSKTIRIIQGPILVHFESEWDDFEINRAFSRVIIIQNNNNNKQTGKRLHFLLQYLSNMTNPRSSINSNLNTTVLNLNIPLFLKLETRYMYFRKSSINGSQMNYQPWLLLLEHRGTALLLLCDVVEKYKRGI